jgi:Ca2+-binding RTX toxin-like protein
MTICGIDRKIQVGSLGYPVSQKILGEQSQKEQASKLHNLRSKAMSVVIGTDNDDLIKAGDEADTINGGKGDDRVFGGDGFDVVKGGDGFDSLFGNEGDDSIFGDKGDDYLRGGRGNDYVKGGQGNDLVLGKRGDDTVLGEDGDDTVLGGKGKDTVRGGKGNDLLDGGAGVDILEGGQGMDTFVVDVLTEGGMFVIEDQINQFGFGGELDTLVLRLGDDTLTAVFSPELAPGTTIDDGTKLSIDVNGLISFVDDSADDLPSF